MSEFLDDNSERVVFYPNEENLGRNCQFWGILSLAGCDFPKSELNGRMSCEGMVDDICLFIKDDREPISLSKKEQLVIKVKNICMDEHYLPPGEPM